MEFLRASVDRAIVMTQYDLRGFGHPLGIRITKKHPKYHLALMCNFMSFCCMSAEKGKQIDGALHYTESTFEQYRSMCKELATFCEGSEKEAIQLIIKAMARQHMMFRRQIRAGRLEENRYFAPVVKTTITGKVLLSLAEAFGVSLVVRRGWIVSVG